RVGLDPVTWLAHGIDVVEGQIRYLLAERTSADLEKRDAAFAFLMSKMDATVRAAGGRLLVVFLPVIGEKAAPSIMAKTASLVGYDYMDLSEAFLAHRDEHPHLADNHPSV